ncbi:unnamed protein product [Blepharisma stoltei]|uniref:DUF7107 domain-containing protein n=1 Tax=Blepharisma stoltei TaxID=1481888 RepID=A0AAU9JKQ7_9CILI|nr:unnamed protein product [Blepharisma stoltei]
MQKGIILTCTLILIQSQQIETECPIYRCHDESKAEDECAIVNGPDFIIKPCPEGQSCDPTIRKCVKSSKVLAFPGNKCDSEQKCLWDCIDGVCRGKKEFENCHSEIECDSELMCYKGSCRKKISHSEKCLKDYECPNDEFCYNGACTKYFSLKSGEFIHSCIDYESKQCSSGMCYSYRCIDELSIERFEKNPCSDHFCEVVHGDMQFYHKCSCGLSPNGDSYCESVATDPVRAVKRKLWKKWVNSKEIHNCNTIQRFDLSCVKDWDYELYKNILYYDIIIKNFAKLQNIEECVQNSVFPQIRDLIEQVDGSYGIGLFLYLMTLLLV